MARCRLALDMDWDSVRLFLALARAGSVRAAARDLGVDASTVTRRLATLEEGLGARLFERSGAQYVCTPRGREMQVIAERIASEMKLLERVAQPEADTSRVRVSCPTMLSGLVAEAIKALAEERPDVVIELEANDARVDRNSHQADVVVRIELEPDPALVGRRVGQLPVGLFATSQYAEQHPFELTDPRHGWIEWDPTYDNKPPMHWVRVHYPQRRVVGHGTTGEAVFQAVRAGVGLGLVPALVGASAGFACLLELPPETFPTVWVLSASDAHEAEAVRAVRNRLFSLGERLVPASRA